MTSRTVLGLVVVLVLGTGCVSGGSGYVPFKIRSLADGTPYRVEIRRAESSRNPRYFESLFYKGDNRDEPNLVLRGKVSCVALDEAGTRLVATMTPVGGPGQYGDYYLRSPPVAVFISTERMVETRRWLVDPPGLPARTYLCRFDRMAFSSDGRRLAIYYWKPGRSDTEKLRPWPGWFELTRTGPGYRQTLTMWDVATGRFLAEMELPWAEPKQGNQPRVYHFLMNVYDIRFSADDRYVALAGIEARNLPSDPQPDGPVLVWRVSDGARVLWVRTPGCAFVHRVCFNKRGDRLACVARGRHPWWCCLDVFIWDIPTRRIVARRRIWGDAYGLTWDDSANAFVVHLEGDSRVPVPNPQTTQPSRTANQGTSGVVHTRPKD